MSHLHKKITIVALLLIAFACWKAKSTAAKTPPPQVWNPSCIASVPRTWGAFRGGSAQTGLAFEDNAGTLRFATNLPCDGSQPQVALEIRRTAGTGSGSSGQ